jgi:ERCC4-related helicase
MKQHQVMKHPEDIDLFEPRQVEITEALEEIEDPISKMTNNALERVAMAMALLASFGPLELWQRAAFEIHRKIEPGSIRSKGMAETVWNAVQFLQECHRLNEEQLAADPELKKRLEDHLGITLDRDED